MNTLTIAFSFRWWQFVLSQKNLVSSIALSFLVAMVGSLCICLPAAYAFARISFPLKHFFQFSFLFANAFPRMGLHFSIAIIFYKLNLMGAFPGVFFIHLLGTLMYMTWIPAGPSGVCTRTRRRRRAMSERLDGRPSGTSPCRSRRPGSWWRAIPVLTEIDDSLTMDPDDLEGKITDGTRVIMPVHMLGNPSAKEEIMAVARERKLLLLEDCCQALGARHRGRPIGTLGDIGAFSLNINKTITCGDGGIVATDSRELYERAFGYHDQGHRPLRMGLEIGARSIPGINLRMNELTGAFALGQLEKLDRILARSIALSVGVVDPGLGAGFGINVLSSDQQIAEVAERFIRVARSG